MKPTKEEIVTNLHSPWFLATLSSQIPRFRGCLRQGKKKFILPPRPISYHCSEWEMDKQKTDIARILILRCFYPNATVCKAIRSPGKQACSECPAKINLFTVVNLFSLSCSLYAMLHKGSLHFWCAPFPAWKVQPLQAWRVLRFDALWSLCLLNQSCMNVSFWLLQ